MHYFLIAGEASGDLHGADLVSAIRQIDRDAVISFSAATRWPWRPDTNR